MSASLDNNNRLKCALCENLATATCDHWDKKKGSACNLPVCHLHKKRTFGRDTCQKHFRSERAHQAERAANSQQTLF